MRISGKKTVAAILCSATLALSISATVAYADFGSGVAVLSEGTEIVKTAISGKKIVFSDVDIKQGLCITDFEKIKITSVPTTSEGTLLLAGRRVGAGTTIKRKNIGALVFIPASREVTECRFKFTTDDFANGAEVDFVIKFCEKVNYAPTINAPESEETALKTQREISVFGKMSATDKEDDLLEYTVIKYPKVGNLKVIDKNSGEYLYTPPTDYVGEDSFTYVCRDEWGNYSKPQTVSITVDERMSEVIYTDMTTHPEYNAAVALTAMGVMDGRLIGDGVYFMPDSSITLAEFVTMAMKCAGITPDNTLTETFFDDNAEISSPMMGYIATAQKLGIITGSFTDGKLILEPNKAITRTEAAVIMSNILDTGEDYEMPVFKDENTVPVWAKGAVGVMCTLGIFDTETDLILGDSALTKSECASYLYKFAEKAK